MVHGQWTIFKNVFIIKLLIQCSKLREVGSGGLGTGNGACETPNSYGSCVLEKTADFKLRLQMHNGVGSVNSVENDHGINEFIVSK